MSGGFVSRVEGKFVFTVQSYGFGDRSNEDEGDSLTTIRQAEGDLRIRRLSPSDGRVLWEHFQPRAPLDIQFRGNSIQLVFQKEVPGPAVPVVLAVADRALSSALNSQSCRLQGHGHASCSISVHNSQGASGLSSGWFRSNFNKPAWPRVTKSLYRSSAERRIFLQKGHNNCVRNGGMNNLYVACDLGAEIGRVMLPEPFTTASSW